MVCNLANTTKDVSTKCKKQRRRQRAKTKSKADKNAGLFGVTSRPEKSNTKKEKEVDSKHCQNHL